MGKERYNSFLNSCFQTKQFNRKHNRISDFNYFSGIILPCFPTNPSYNYLPSVLGKYTIANTFGSNYIMCQTTVCPPWERKFS